MSNVSLRFFGAGLLLSGLCSWTAAHGAGELPVNGVYYDPAESGRGYVIEHQKGIVSILFFGYAKDGKPEWYLASGPWRNDVSGIGDGPIGEGYFPIHGMSGVVYRFEGGTCFACNTPYTFPTKQERVGTVELYVGYLRQPQLKLSWDSEPFDELETVEPTLFGYAKHPTPSPGGLPQLPDLRGDWVFVDRSRPESTPERFNFTTVVSEDTSTTTSQPRYRVVYTDSAKNAELRCHMSSLEPNLKRPGCELVKAGVVLFSAAHRDVSLNAIDAFSGPLPASSSTVLRGAITIRGMRVN